ncbi:MAG: 1-acyl-sn-glycerol-3-phosphate acyltransferase, partial [Bacteroidetes bacterium]|nr:1-acyl-sn-glycerol-3-phosphate acyltransferase [Bacteroidota bacterium]
EALVVPVAIDNSWKMVRYGQFPLNTFIAMKWEVLKPIEPDGRPLDDVVKDAETAIRQKLKQ